MKTRNLLSFISVFIIALTNAQDVKPPQITRLYEPIPEVVTPGEGTLPPSDAIVLFNGKDMSGWLHENGKPAEWVASEGVMTVKPKSGHIVSEKSFGDVQLHIEWRTPEVLTGEGQKRGNSGVWLMSRYEVQILDSYDNETYVNGQAAAIYKQHIPLVNACRKPGEWQTYDIIFMAPRFNSSGRVIIPARITVIHNGVLVQNNVELLGSTENVGSPRVYPPHEEKMPLKLQDHGNLVSFRNIWVREL